ncbi:endoglucanase 11-like, partial [Macadamia integrifolia]|uniref:endoglucanase 11-like n=1 Tax=Macadamia integrifolia TaxID=60698 RepID=UPI001C4EDE46
LLMEGNHREHTDILEQYRSKAEHYLCGCLNKNDDDNVKCTPAGLLYVRQWNNMQYVSTAAFLLNVYSDYLHNSTQKLHCQRGEVKPQELMGLAKAQENFMVSEVLSLELEFARLNINGAMDVDIVQRSTSSSSLCSGRTGISVDGQIEVETAKIFIKFQ